MKPRLIEHWHLWWRRWSTWIAVINGLLAGYIFSQPILVIGLLGFAPDGYRVPLSIGAALLAFGLPVLVTNLRQPKLKAKCDAQSKPEPAPKPKPKPKPKPPVRR